MIIGGIQKSSLIDFPAKVSCVIFTAGCNFDCPYCHNPDLVKPPFETIDPEEIFEFLEKRKSLLDGIVITGGEPTLQKDLPNFCQKIKSLGYAVKLDTNGSSPEILQSLIENRQIDYLAMDIKTLPAKYAACIAPKILSDTITASIALVKNSKIAHEFRTTCLKPFVDADIILEIARLIKGADRLVLQKAKITQDVLHPEFFHHWKWGFSTSELEVFQTITAPFVKETLIR